MMDRRWDDLESARTYLKNSTQFSFFSTGVLTTIFRQHRQTVDGIDQFPSTAAAAMPDDPSTAVTDANITY